MFWTFLALAMTALMGGLIAYNGDLIGRKYGKRRVTLFGLRPKHTAILVTSFTGFLISGLTTVVLFLLVPPVRAIIMEGEDAIRHVPMLKHDVSRLEMRQRTTQADLDMTRKEATDARQDRIKAEGQLADVQCKLNDEKKALKDNQRLNASLQQKNSTLASKNRDLVSMNQDLAAGNVTLKEHNLKLSSLNTGLEQDIKAKKIENAELARVNNELKRANTELAAKNEQYDRKNAELAQQSDRLTRDNEKLERDKEKLLTINRRMLDDNYVLDSKISALNETLRRLGEQANIDLNSLINMVKTIRTRRVVIQGGEDLARKVVPARANSEQVRSIIKELVHEANSVALTKGAGSGSGGSLHAVQVVNKQFLTPNGTGQAIPVEVSETDRTNAMVSRLAGSDTPVCLLAIAIENSVEGEPATIDFQPFNDRLIYPKGRVVAAPRRLNATETPARVYSDLMSFLHDLGQSAVERGMIPRIDPATGSPQVGSLDWPELVDLADRVRSYGRIVKVTAIAAADTPASGPLKLDFKIDPSL